MSHPHPYYDYKVGDQVAITTLAGPCIAFDEGLADFIHLVRTTTDKDLVITIPPKARLTPAFDRLVDATGCIVLVRESSGDTATSAPAVGLPRSAQPLRTATILGSSSRRPTSSRTT